MPRRSSGPARTVIPSPAADSGDRFVTVSESTFRSVVWVCYVIVLLVVVASHEPWRDELQAWGIGMDSTNLASLFRLSPFEGHPRLWHLLLYGVGHLARGWWLVAAVHTVIAATTAWIVLRYAPFSRRERVLMVFGYYFLFEYAVVVRVYGLGVLLAVLAMVCWTGQRQRPVLTALILIILANTSLMGLLVAVTATAAFFIEWAWTSSIERRAARVWAMFATVGAICILAAAGVYVQAAPPTEAWRDPARESARDSVRKSARESARRGIDNAATANPDDAPSTPTPGASGPDAEPVARGISMATSAPTAKTETQATRLPLWRIGVSLSIAARAFLPLAEVSRDGTVWQSGIVRPRTPLSLALAAILSGLIVSAALISCARRWSAVFMLAFGFAIIAVFSFTVRADLSTRHFGHLVVIWVLALWLARSGEASDGAWRRWTKRSERGGPILVAVLQLPMIVAGLQYVVGDIRYPFSDASHVAHLLEKPEFDGVPIIGQARAESMAVAALLDRRIWSAVEGRFTTHHDWNYVDPRLPAQLDTPQLSELGTLRAVESRFANACELVIVQNSRQRLPPTLVSRATLLFQSTGPVLSGERFSVWRVKRTNPSCVSRRRSESTPAAARDGKADTSL